MLNQTETANFEQIVIETILCQFSFISNHACPSDVEGLKRTMVNATHNGQTQRFSVVFFNFLKTSVTTWIKWHTYINNPYSAKLEGSVGCNGQDETIHSDNGILIIFRY